MRCSTVTQNVPFISLSQRHRAASKNCKCSQFWSGSGREISWCSTEKSARHQAAPKGSPQTLSGRRLDWGVKLVPGRNKSALDETWAMLQTIKQYYISIGWRDTNCLEDWMENWEDKVAYSSQHHTLPSLNWAFNPDKTQNSYFRSILHISKNHTCKATLQNNSFLFFLQHQCHTVTK